jgi:AcrR family transcriptional regulator
VALRAQDLLPAPGRGQYDRAQSRVARQAEQRERLIQAAAQAFANGPLTVARIVAVAGVGRNTFYEYFDDPEHALAAAEARTLAALEARAERELAAARTPLEALRSAARAWFAVLDAEPLGFRIALRMPVWHAGSALSAIGQGFAKIVARALEQSQKRTGIAARPSPLKIVATAAAAEALARARLVEPERTHYEVELSDVMSRLLR